jgi:hypothetical protein
MTAINAADHLAANLLCDLKAGFDQFQIFPTALGTRMVAVTSGGTVIGPDLEGEVLPGGGDWLLLAADGIARMDVRATIRTIDGEMIYMTGLGRAGMGTSARDRFLAGETVQDDEVRSRLALLFEADAADHKWLNTTVAVGYITELSRRHINYRVYGLA